jgi:hypothetical protein
MSPSRGTQSRTASDPQNPNDSKAELFGVVLQPPNIQWPPGSEFPLDLTDGPTRALAAIRTQCEVEEPLFLKRIGIDRYHRIGPPRSLTPEWHWYIAFDFYDAAKNGSKVYSAVMLLDGSILKAFQVPVLGEWKGSLRERVWAIGDAVPGNLVDWWIDGLMDCGPWGKLGRQQRMKKYKKYLFAVVTGCLGLCAGFTLCYVYLVLPQREIVTAASLPQQVSGQGQIVITIAADGSSYLAGQRIELDRLGRRLKELAAQRRPIAIRADKDAPLKAIVAVMDASKAAARNPK